MLEAYANNIILWLWHPVVEVSYSSLQNNIYSKSDNFSSLGIPIFISGSQERLVVSSKVKRAGPFLLGPNLGHPPPVKCMQQYLGRKEQTHDFYTLKVKLQASGFIGLEIEFHSSVSNFFFKFMARFSISKLEGHFQWRMNVFTII